MVKISDSASALIGTSLGPVLLSAARSALTQAQAATEPGDELQPSIVAILCAAAALEAATNWTADEEPGWIDQPLPPPSKGTRDMLPPDRKWAAWIEHRTGSPVDLGKDLGQRVVQLIDDRNLIAHFRGVRGKDRKRAFHLPPDANDNRSRVRTYFSPSRASDHVRTAEDAIAALA